MELNLLVKVHNLEMPKSDSRLPVVIPMLEELLLFIVLLGFVTTVWIEWLDFARANYHCWHVFSLLLEGAASCHCSHVGERVEVVLGNQSLDFLPFAQETWKDLAVNLVCI